MKLRKTISVLCSLAMIVSALPAASAVDAEPLSDAAGETVIVRVTNVQADGQTTQEQISVDIPEGATAAEEHNLIQAAALASVDGGTRATSESPDFLFEGGCRLTSSFARMFSFSLPRDYDRLLFEFNGGTIINNNPSVLYLRATNQNSTVFNFSAFLENQYNTSYKCADVYIYNGNTVGGNQVNLTGGSALTFEGRVNSGSISFAGLIVKGYY